MTEIIWHEISGVSEIDNSIKGIMLNVKVQTHFPEMKKWLDLQIRRAHIESCLSTAMKFIRMKIWLFRLSIWIKQETWKMKNRSCPRDLHNNHQRQEKLEIFLFRSSEDLWEQEEALTYSLLYPHHQQFMPHSTCSTNPSWKKCI